MCEGTESPVQQTPNQ